MFTLTQKSDCGGTLLFVALSLRWALSDGSELASLFGLISILFISSVLKGIYCLPPEADIGSPSEAK